MNSKRGRTKVARAERRGQGGSGSTHCFKSDGSDFGAEHLLSASPSVSTYSVHFSCPFYCL